MPAPKVSFLASIANKLFAKRIADAQQKLWELCAWGPLTVAPGEKSTQERIIEQLERGAKLDVLNKDGDTPLILLCRRGRTLEAHCLIARGANIHIVNNAGETAFLAAAAAGCGGLIGVLLAKGADPRATLPDGRNAVQLMVHANPDFKTPGEKQFQANGLGLLLAAGLTLDNGLKMAIYHHKPHLLPVVQEIEAVHALATSAAEDSAENVKLLLSLGIKPDAPAAFKDDTPLCAGTSSGNLEMMEALLESGADIDLKSPKTHRTPLQTAVRNGQREAFALLLDSGAAIDGSMELLELARDSGKAGILRDVYDALAERGIIKVTVDTAKAAMKTIRLKAPA